MEALEILREEKVFGTRLQIYGTAAEPFFLARDVASWIEHSNPAAMADVLDEDEKGIRIVYTPGGPQAMTVISENGLYELLMLSRKPIARAFKKEIKSILKSIRQTGGYILGQEKQSAEELLANALVVAQNIIASRDRSIQEMAPKAAFYDAVADSRSALSMAETAKILGVPGIGQNKLFALLREMGMLMSDNLPYQDYIERGYFRVIEQKYSKPDGTTMVSPKTLVLQKGLDYIRRKAADRYG